MVYDHHCHPQNKIDYKTTILTCKPLVLLLLEIIGTCGSLILNFDMKPIKSDNVMWLYAIQLKQIKVCFLCLRFNVIWPWATKLKHVYLYLFFHLSCVAIWLGFMKFEPPSLFVLFIPIVSYINVVCIVKCHITKL